MSRAATSARVCRLVSVLSLVLLAVAGAAWGRVAGAQSTPGASASVHGAAPPFSPGERLTYGVSFGPIRVGGGSMELTTGDSLRGHATLHAVFRLHGGVPLLRVNDIIESWFDASSLISLRFTQQLHEGRYHASRRFEMYPERQVYQQEGEDEQASVSEPLDDVSFLYFLRSIPLDVGKRYEFYRYFQPEGNPVVVTVLRRERITVPAGTYDAVVVRPEITTQGLFSKGGRAEVWLRADSAHEVLQLHSHLAVGSLSLYLTGRERMRATDDTVLSSHPRNPSMTNDNETTACPCASCANHRSVSPPTQSRSRR